MTVHQEVSTKLRGEGRRLLHQAALLSLLSELCERDGERLLELAGDCDHAEDLDRLLPVMERASALFHDHVARMDRLKPR